MKHFFLSAVFVLTISCSYAQFEMPSIDELPVRMTRTIGVSMNIGWNSLVGVGPTLQYYISPHFGLDAGVGLSMPGVKFGGRARYLFLESKFTPFVAVGVNHALGGGDTVLEMEDSNTLTTIFFKVKPSTYLPITVGGELLTGGGFFLMFDLGYSVLVSGDNIDIVSGTPTDNQDRALDILYRSGLVIDFGFGYIFKNKRGYRGTF